MWQLICTIIYAFIYLSHKSESYIINSNTTAENELTNYSYHNQETEEDIKAFENTSCKCKNGDCVYRNGVEECQCWPEYGAVNGDSSNCDVCNCGEGSNCTIEVQWWNGREIQCICKEGYKVEKQTCIGPCTKHPCQNGGTCFEVRESYMCYCTDEFTGVNCEKRKEICECWYGDCVEINGKTECKCWPGYRKWSDTICIEENCECWNGDCVEINGKTKCKCWPGYRKLSDTRCIENCVPDCVYGKCEEKYGQTKCRCDDNYEGPACDKMKLNKKERKESYDFVFLIAAGAVCFCCILISLITLVIVYRKFKLIKK